MAKGGFELTRPFQSFVIICSDRATKGQYEDTSGPAALKWLEQHGCNPIGHSLIPDEENTLNSEVLMRLLEVELIVISGGTGLGPKDITPQTLSDLADYEIPGFGELLRKESLKYSLNAYLSRCSAYVKHQKLILALPGNPKAVNEQLDILEDLIHNAICALRGECKHRRRTDEEVKV